MYCGVVCHFLLESTSKVAGMCPLKSKVSARGNFQKIAKKNSLKQAKPRRQMEGKERMFEEKKRVKPQPRKIIGGSKHTHPIEIHVYSA